MSGLRRFVAVYGGSSAHHRALHEPKYARWLAGTVYLPELAEADLSAYDGVIVPERLHAGLQQASRPRLLETLDRGGWNTPCWCQVASSSVRCPQSGCLRRWARRPLVAPRSRHHQ